MIDTQELFSKIGESKLELNEANKEIIYERIPVPRDYKILWADVKRLKTIPFGIVLTDKALVIKGNSNANHNKIVISDYYRVIPWEYFDIENFEIKGKSLFIDNIEFEFEDNSFFKVLNDYREIYNANLNSFAMYGTPLINTTGVNFNANNNVNNYSAGHGFYFEEAEALSNKMKGSTVIGHDNAKNGPDLNIGGEAFQLKCCKTAKDSIDALFGDDGKFKYNLSQKVMKAEIPKDQYQEGIKILKEKIIAGKVDGVTDPEQASNILKPGKYTYDQCVNMGKAGTIDSIVYDAKTGAVNCTCIFGFTFVITFYLRFIKDNNYKEALKEATANASKVFGISFFSYILTSQISRTKFINSDNWLTSGVSKLFKLNKTSAKAISSSIIVASITALATSILDVYKYVEKRISKTQVIKDVMFSVWGVACLPLSTALTCLVMKKMKIKNGLNSILKIVFSFIIYYLLLLIPKLIIGLFKETDEKIVGRLFSAQLSIIAMDYLLTEDEIKLLIKKLDNAEFKDMYSKLICSYTQVEDIRKILIPIVEKYVSLREVMDEDDINKALKKGDFLYEM